MQLQVFKKRSLSTFLEKHPNHTHNTLNPHGSNSLNFVFTKDQLFGPIYSNITVIMQSHLFKYVNWWKMSTKERFLM